MSKVAFFCHLVLLSKKRQLQWILTTKKQKTNKEKHKKNVTFWTTPHILANYTLNVVEWNVLRQQTLMEVQNLEHSFVASASLAATSEPTTMHTWKSRQSRDLLIVSNQKASLVHQFIRNMLYLYLGPSTQWYDFLSYSVKLIIHI